MAGSKKLEVQIVGDASRLSKSFGDASKSAGGFGDKMMKVGKVAALGLAGGLAAVGYGLKKSIDAALEAEKAQTRLDAAFKSASVSAKERAAAMEQVNTVSMKSGLDDEDLMDTLSRLTRVTGSASKAQRDMGIAADLARARGIELSAATMIVTKAELGNVGALKRIGIEIPKVTAAQDALKESHGKVTAEQMKQAKATDDLATRQSAIAALQTGYAGAAEAYGKTAAGAQERFQVAVENLQESIGAHLLPVLTRFLTWVVANMPAFERITKQVFDKVGAIIQALTPTFNALIAGIRAIVQFAVANWPKVQEAAAKVVAWYKGTLQPAIQNVVAVVTAIWAKFGGAITAIAKTAFGMVTTIVRNGLKIIQAVIEGVLALIRGDWTQAWNSLKTIVSTVLGSIGALIRGFASIAFTAARAIGGAIVSGVLSGMSGLFSSVKDHIVGSLKGAISAAGGILHGSGDYMFTRHAVGAPLAQGIVEGMDGGLALLAPKMQAKIKAAIDRAKAMVDAAKTKMQAAFSLMSDKILRSFDAKRGGIKTPAEAMLDAISDRRQGEDLQKALAEAIAGGDQEAIFRAQEDIQIAALQRQAENERTALDQHTEAMREKLEGQLSMLSETWKGGTADILKLLKTFGVSFGSVGALLCSEFRQSLIAAINGASRAAVSAGNIGAGPGGGSPQTPIRGNTGEGQQVIQLIVDKKVLAEVVREGNAVYQRANGALPAV